MAIVVPYIISLSFPGCIYNQKEKLKIQSVAIKFKIFSS
jgi:hypothetical protein